MRYNFLISFLTSTSPSGQSIHDAHESNDGYNGQVVNGAVQEVRLTPWSLKGFELMMKFMYTGCLEFDDSKLLDLLANLVQFGFNEEATELIKLVKEKAT